MVQSHAAQWRPGTRVGDYEIVEHLATGGMADVYVAVLKGGGEPVVIKAMSRKLLSNDEFVRMFLDEARLIASLRHPNIGEIYDRGDHEGTHYFVMELVQGLSCREIVNRATREHSGHVPFGHALEICRDIAEALHYAHERCGPDGKPLGIIHRDVSHSNVLVTFEGVTKLIDFGVAKSSMRSTETKVGSLKGKIRYMSPEQIRCDPLDRRSDLFSLGIMTWEMTTGHRLFRADNDAAILHKILYDEVPAPSLVCPGYPAELERAVLRALARRPEDRQPSCAVFAQELTAAAALAGPTAPLREYLQGLFGEQIARSKQRFAELRRRSRAPGGLGPARGPSAALEARPSAKPAPPAPLNPPRAPAAAARIPHDVLAAAATLRDAQAQRERRQGEPGAPASAAAGGGEPSAAAAAPPHGLPSPALQGAATKRRVDRSVVLLALLVAIVCVGLALSRAAGHHAAPTTIQRSAPPAR